MYNSTSNAVNCSASATNKTLMLVHCDIANGNQNFGVKQAGESSFTTKHQSASAGITSNNYTIAVFAMNSYGTINVSENGTRIQSVKIWSSPDYATGLIFNGVACEYNGEYGLWDKVSNTFFGNAAGSGAFSGPQI